MKRWAKFLLPFLLLVAALIISLALAFFAGYQKVDLLATHHTVQPQEFNKKFQPSELKTDLDFLVKTLEDVHPDLYVYTPKSVFTQAKGKIAVELNSSMSRLDFYLRVAPLVAMLNEGHTKLYPPWEEYHHFLRNGGLVFPFDLDLRESRAFITADYSSDTLIAAGSELLSINAIPIKQIVDSLLNFISSEKIATKLESLEESFRHSLWLIYKFEGDFEVEFTSNLDGKRYIQKIAGITYDAIKTKTKPDSEETTEVYYTYHSSPHEKIGIIDFRKFVDLEKFEIFLRRTFEQIQKEGVTDLIIDIRENPGGYSELEDVFLSYISDKPVINCLKMDIKVSKQLKNYLRSTLRWYVKWLPIQYIHPTWRKIWTTPEGDLVIIRQEPEKPKYNPLRFDGGVYVLIGPSTYSTAQDFAAAIQDYKLGTLIGEETGGVASSFGAWYPFDLPNTRLWVFVSTKRILRPSEKHDGRGVVPDYEVKQSVEDPEKKINTVMDFAKELIKSNRSKTEK